MQFCRNVLLETKLNMRVSKNLKLNLAMTYFTMKPEGGGRGGGHVYYMSQLG